MPIQAFIQPAHKGASVAAEIRATAERLRELMVLAHGGKWRLRINHDTCYVLISRRFSDHEEVKL